MYFFYWSAINLCVHTMCAFIINDCVQCHWNGCRRQKAARIQLICLHQWPLTHLPLDKMAAILADDILKCILLNENDRIQIKISLKFVPMSPIDNKPALVQVMSKRRIGPKPLPKLIDLLTPISSTREKWVIKECWQLWTWQLLWRLILVGILITKIRLLSQMKCSFWFYDRVPG